MSNSLREVSRVAVAAILLATATAGSLSVSAATGANPILTDAYTADPAPLVVGNTVYLYTGHDEPGSGFYTMNDWRCYSSQDMKTWTSHGSILSPTNFTWASGSAWAGQCVEKNGKYYWYVPMQGSGGYGGFNIGVAVSDSPTGPFVDARGTPLITDGMTTGGDAWDDIDPTVFTDTNGVSWLGWGHGTFYLAQLATNMAELAGPIQVNRSLPYFTEGPWLHRRGNLYYVTYASSVAGGGETIRYATATNLAGPWTPRGLITGYAANSYTIHPGICEFNAQAYLFYHNGTLSGGGSFDRSVCLDYLYYNPDGTIQPIFQTAAGVSVPPRNDDLPVGSATQTWPANGATNLPWSPNLRWLVGSNAVAHAVYVGTSSNAVAQATFASPEYQGTSATTNFTPAGLAAQTMYFWRVDEIRGTNMSHGAVGWFTTGPFLSHRYSFSESGGSSVADAAGGPAWTGTLPNGGTLAAGKLALSSGAQQYASLPAGIVNQAGGITLMTWVNLSSSNTWNRIFDFGSGTTTYMYLTPARDGGTLRFSIRTPSGGEQAIGSSATVSTGVWHQVAVTLSGATGIPGMSGAGGSGALYLDGVRVGGTEDLTLNPASLGGTVNNYLGKSQFNTDPYLNGAIDEFRIYNGALTANDIAQAYFVGPSQVSSGSALPWMTQDVGAVGIAGSATFANGVFTATGSGDDIWNAADAFRYVYVPATGNCTIVARVASLQNIDAWSKAGVMIRESLAANAANAYIAVTPSNGVTFQYRSSTAGNTANNNTPGLNAPYWVKLVRSGSTFTGYRSSDGANWTQMGSATIGMASTVYAGLAVTSHNNSSSCTATFDNVVAPGWPTSFPPPAPAGLNATPGNAQAVLSWEASSTAASYNVKRAVTNGGPYTVVTNVTTTNCTDTGLINGTTYYYVVSALNVVGESADSAQASATPQVLAPTGLSATTVSTSQINLAWNTLSNATRYNVKRSLTNGGPYATIASGLTVTNFQDDGLAGGTMYYYVVSAVVGGSETTNSTQAAAATLSPTVGSLVHRYSFDESGGSTIADAVGGPVWNGTLPNGGTLAGGQLALSSSSLQYATLPAGIVNSMSNVTVMAWVNLASVTYWSRLFDFGSDTTSYLYVTPRNGFDYTARFAISTSGAGGEQKINGASAVNPSAWHQVAVSLNAGIGILYVDGVAIGTNSSLSINPSSLGSTTHNYLGRSQSGSEPYYDGLLDEFRIYNAGLSAAEIAATVALGPDELLSTNRPAISLAPAGTDLMLSWPLANAGYSLQSCTNLVTGAWEDVTSPTPQMVGDQWQMQLPSVAADQVFYRLIK